MIPNNGFSALNKIDNRELLNKISALTTNISKTETNTNTNDVNNIIGNILQNNDNHKVEDLLNSIEVGKARLQRYDVYDEIIKSVPLVKKIVKTYTTNILIKNPLNHKMYTMTKETSESDDPEVSWNQKFIKHCCSHFNIFKMLRTLIVPQYLKYGNFFVEVINIKKTLGQIDVKSMDSILLESDRLVKSDTFSNYDTNLAYSLLAESFLIDDIDSSIYHESTESKVDESTKNLDLTDIIIRYHLPRKIVKLATDSGHVFGYVEVISNKSANSGLQSLTNLVDRVKSSSGMRNNDESQQQIISKLTNHVLSLILKSSSNSSTDVSKKIAALSDDAYSVFSQLFLQSGLFTKTTQNKSMSSQFKVRFISSDNMVDFSNISSEYFPYGESVIDNLILPGKLYMLSQLSNIINKLSKSALVRTWKIDVGQLQMQTSQVQKLKRELYNTRITVDDLSSIKSIPKILSDYKDIFLINKNGRSAVDASVEAHGDPSIKVQDLEDSRRELIAISGIPAPYLGYNDVVELREQLVHANISFATDIIDFQEAISDNINELIRIIAHEKGLEVDPTQYFKIKLIPPTVLILQTIESTISSVSSIVGSLKSMGLDDNIDSFDLLEQYVPYVDWDKFKSKLTKQKTIKKIETDLQGDAGNGDRY